MKIIWYAGLFSEYSLLRKHVLKKYSSFYFDYDLRCSNFTDLLNFAELSSVQSLIINVIQPTLKFENFEILGRQFNLLSNYVDELIITSPNDLFTLVLKKYISSKGQNNVNYAFHLSDNVDDNSHFICDSSRPVLARNPNVQKVILDDRANDNQGLIYKRFSFSHKDTSLITQSVYKKARSY